MTIALTRPAGARLGRDQATILARYAGGDSATTIAAATGLALDVVGRVLDELAGNNRDLARKLVHEHTEYAQSVAAAKGGAPAPRPAPPSLAAPAAVTGGQDGIAGLLKTAANSGDARLQKSARTISELLRALRDDLAAHARQAELRAEIAQLESRVADLKKQLRPGRTAPAHSTSASSPTAAAAHPASAQFRAAVRAWAQQAGVACSATGRISAAVLDAYRAAHPGDDQTGRAGGEQR